LEAYRHPRTPPFENQYTQLDFLTNLDAHSKALLDKERIDTLMIDLSITTRKHLAPFAESLLLGGLAAALTLSPQKAAASQDCAELFGCDWGISPSCTEYCVNDGGSAEYCLAECAADYDSCMAENCPPKAD